MPRVIITLDYGSKYLAESGSSVVDPAASARYEESVKPVRAFVNYLVRTSDRCVAQPERAAFHAKCCAAALQQWARGDGLMKPGSHQGYMVMIWSLATIAVSCMKIELFGGVETAGNVKRWIGDLAGIAAAHMQTDREKLSRNNNHLYWLHWSRMASAIVLQDQEIFGETRRGFDNAIAAIDKSGVLPLEMTRRSRALHYHQYALGPIVMMAETLARNGRPGAYRDGDRAIDRLASLVLRGLSDSGVFQALSGVDQDMPAALKSSQMGWMEPYHARYPQPETEAWLTKFRPIIADNLGGDMTQLYARQAR